MSLAWAGGGGFAEQAVLPAQNVMQQPASEDLGHNVLHTIIDVMPGGVWGLLGLAFLGGLTLLWWHVRKHVRAWIGHVVHTQIEKRKRDA